MGALKFRASDRHESRETPFSTLRRHRFNPSIAHQHFSRSGPVFTGLELFHGVFMGFGYVRCHPQLASGDLARLPNNRVVVWQLRSGAGKE
jgi:hypothetical protein